MFPSAHNSLKFFIFVAVAAHTANSPPLIFSPTLVGGPESGPPRRNVTSNSRN